MRKKSIAVIAICVVIFIAIFKAETIAISNRNVFDIFFWGYNGNKAQELLDYNRQSVKVDEYTISLEQTLFDTRTSMGCLVFAITKDNGKPEMSMNVWDEGIDDCFGENKRFYTEIESTGGQTRKFKYVGDTLYEYLSFSASKNYDLTVGLIDNSKSDIRTNSGKKVYTFKIKDNSKCIEYQIDESTNLAISPLGITIDTNQPLGDISIMLHYKNGKEEKVVDTLNEIGTGGSNISCSNEIRRYQFVFKRIKDIDEIEYIIYNNSRYTVD